MPALPPPPPSGPAEPGQLSWVQRLTRQLPSQCVLCRSWPSQPVCPECLARFDRPIPRCPGCALRWQPQPGAGPRCPDCVRQPLPLRACFAALDYVFPWSGLLTRLKFQQQTGWAGFFTQRLLTEPGVAETLAALGATDWLLPMPLSPERLGERGFNQSWELAKALRLASRCQARLSASLLLRLRHTAPQSALNRRERLDNVRGAFAVEPLQAHQLAGAQVVLIDDVMTSGASLSAAAQALLAAGACSVTGLVIARTPP